MKEREGIVKCRICDGAITPELKVTFPEYEGVCYHCYKEQMPTVCVDFDGVLAEYDGWKGPDILGAPKEGALVFVHNLVGMGYKVIIHSTRHEKDIEDWCRQHDFLSSITAITNIKMPAVAYIDDRAIRFDGHFGTTLFQLKMFQPYWKNKSETP